MKKSFLILAVLMFCLSTAALACGEGGHDKEGTGGGGGGVTASDAA